MSRFDTIILFIFNWEIILYWIWYDIGVDVGDMVDKLGSKSIKQWGLEAHLLCIESWTIL